MKRRPSFFAPSLPQWLLVLALCGAGRWVAAAGVTNHALAAKGEFLVGIDGDALLDPHALTSFVRRFLADDRLSALTGNPRIRNRATLLGRLQVGEFSSVVGLIKRAQTIYGTLFTVSGVICAFRKRALADAGWWSPAALTDDVEVTWRMQFAGWRVAWHCCRYGATSC